jgi:V/A-type H+-transporting ATPase subunit E
MGLEHVRESILAEGRRAAEQELQNARGEAQRIRARAEERATELRAARQHELQLAVQALKRREVALAELEAKKLRLGAQKELLARVRAEALARLGKLPPGTNDQYLSALVKGAGIEDARVFARPEDRAAVERMGLKYAGPAQAVGGLVVESADGTTREDLRYEVLLDDAWPEALGEVAATLFGLQKQQAKGR